MAEHRERLLKLTQDKKINKRLVRPQQATRMGPPPDSGREGSSGSSGSPDAERQSALVSKKRSRPDDGVEVTGGGAAARAFGLPPCFVEKDFFEGFPFTVSDNEADIIKRLDKEGWRKHLTASMVGVVKMAEMAVVLAREGSDSADRVRELESKKAALAAKSRKLKAALERSEEMFREQSDLLSGEKERADRALKERDCLQLDRERLESENQGLSREIEDLKAAMLPAEDEPEGMADLRTRILYCSHSSPRVGLRWRFGRWV
ncbi:unnamed protein product [Vicia faba]|uniref:Uncharacterized protein n=1 Tax=Vicia faba TaxID=3906 RepID=A0AAV1B6J0_VICFA|nr:unnamed protein product [Vicia faba]